MTIGKITSSQQDIVYATVRPEDGTFIETHNGTVKANYYIINSVGEQFTAAHWFGRIKVKIGNADTAGRVSVILYDSPSKTTTYYELVVNLTGGGSVIHFSFDPLPPGNYYLEIVKISGSVGISVVTDSTIHKALKEGSPTTEWDIESKIMHVTDIEVERAVAIVGDAVDGGITMVKEGSNLGAVQVGQVIGNIARVGDVLQNGGVIRTGAWHVQFKE
jgi:hypothetical protein